MAPSTLSLYVVVTVHWIWIGVDRNRNLRPLTHVTATQVSGKRNDGHAERPVVGARLRESWIHQVRASYCTVEVSSEYLTCYRLTMIQHGQPTLEPEVASHPDVTIDARDHAEKERSFTHV